MSCMLIRFKQLKASQNKLLKIAMLQFLVSENICWFGMPDLKEGGKSLSVPGFGMRKVITSVPNTVLNDLEVLQGENFHDKITLWISPWIIYKGASDWGFD